MRIHSLKSLRVKTALGALTVCLFMFGSRAEGAGAWFVMDGQLVQYAGDTAGEAVNVKHKGPVFEFLGALPNDRVLVSLGEPNLLDGMVSSQGVEIAILAPDGSLERSIMKNGVRAWPSPSGVRIAAIDLDYALHLYENGELRPLNIAERVVLAAWAPDESRLCLTAYATDWSPHRAHNPGGTLEFLAMQNNDLHLFDLASQTMTRLTAEPGYDYSGVWYPDGRHVMFISSRDGRGAFFKLNVETGGVEKLTNHAPDAYDIPVGRSDSFVWSAAAQEWVYSAQESNSRRDSVRTLSADGARSRILGFGRQVRLLDDAGAVAFIGEDGRPQSASLIPGLDR